MTSWEETFWGRFPRFLARRRVHGVAAALVGAVAAAPAAMLAIKGRAWAPVFARWALDLVTSTPLLKQIVDNLEPERRAALPARIEHEILRTMPHLVVAGATAALAGAIGVILVGRFLAATLSPDRRSSTTPPLSSSTPRWEWGVVFACGLAAHAYALRESLTTDETAALYHLVTHWGAWADTRAGWQVHMGGELLGTIGLTIFRNNEWGARLPSALCSAAGLAVVYAWLRRRFGIGVAILTVGLTCALPLWWEQTALVRGYGLLYLAGALVIPAAWDVLDGSASHREAAVLARLLTGTLLGFLAHFFFLFLSFALVVLLGWRAWRVKDSLASAGLTWLLIGLVPPGLLYVPGIPMTVYQSMQGTRTTFATVLQRIVDAFGFEQKAALALCAAFFALAILGLWRLTARDRWRALAILVLTTGLPLLMRPVYLYPRFFAELLPLLFIPVVPLGQIARAPATAAAVALALWLAPRPWAHLPTMDLRGGAEAMRHLARPGETVYIERGVCAAQLYLTDLSSASFPIARGFPPHARVVLLGHEWGEPASLPAGYRVMERLPGSEAELLAVVADGG